MLGNGTSIPISQLRSTYFSSNTCDLKLKNLLCVPQLDKNLTYVKKLHEDNSFIIEFFPNTFCVKYLKTKTTILVGKIEDDLFQLPSSQGHQFTNIVT